MQPRDAQAGARDAEGDSMSKGYDPKCGELARYFLDKDMETDDRASDLAQSIQDAIERWFEDNAEAD